MKVTIEGERELQAKIERLTKEGFYSPEAIEALAGVGYGVARSKIAGGSNQAKISIRREVKKDEATIFTVMPERRARSIEEGRRPGEVVGLLGLARWVTGRRYMSSRHLSELDPGDKEAVLSVQEGIRLRGTQGKKYIAGAVAAVKREAPKTMRSVAAKIESNWGR